MGDELVEIQSLANLLREQRLSAMETSALLRRIMSEIDVAVLAFDEQRKLRMVNGHAERLLGLSTEEAIGQPAEHLGLDELLDGQTPRVLDRTFAGRSGRWELRRGTFLEAGLPRQLVILSDLTRTLREEERQAWQRMVHVLRHEVNNSLAPICSLAQSMEALLDRPGLNESKSDLREGLSIIAERSRSLTRFMTAYSQLTRLPPPRLGPVDVGECVRRVSGLETRARVIVRPGPDLVLHADADQVEQLLVNLIRNAAEAVMETGGGVTVGWEICPHQHRFCEIWIEDEGPGIANPANLFVPFYTTKPNGSGIGLALCRQIAEAHGGSVALEPRRGARGSRAICRLPLQVSDSGHRGSDSGRS
jgi:nitrogen fixation/metabolism regulation signal transduction histidine kinase